MGFFKKEITIKVWILSIIVGAILVSVANHGNQSRKEGEMSVKALWTEQRERDSKTYQAEYDRLVNYIEEEKQKQAEHLVKLKEGYNNEIEHINATNKRLANDSLRFPAPTVCKQPADSSGETPAEGAATYEGGIAGTIALPEFITRDLRQLMEKADRIVASCRVDQKFIDDNGLREE